MKTRFSKHVRFLSILWWAALAMAPRAPAQTPPGLNLQLYAGLSITGAVGTVYLVEYVTDLAQTNSWRCLEFLQPPASPYLWADKSTPATGRQFYRSQVFPAPTNLVFIPPSTFRMGSPTNTVDRVEWEGPQTAVTISRGFWMGKYEVTQGEYQAVMGSDPNRFTGDTNWPVAGVNWNEATNYCDRLTQRERAAGRIPANSVFRLPTEAEWEYACRAWTSTQFSYGDDPGYTDLTSYAWYEGNSSGTRHPVGQKLPNPWGLYDMYGNVFKWCQDWYNLHPDESTIDSHYPGGTALDPQGPTGFPAGDSSRGASRGGDWASLAVWIRSAARNDGRYPFLENCCFGFRVVLASVQQ